MTRFSFGRNWTQFATRIRPEQIAGAEQSLQSLLGRETLAGLSFLDVGSGSGLFSLAALNLGARVTSFDFDEESVSATETLSTTSTLENWNVARGSILDPHFISGLGQFDIVYAWGVLHHTGDMWAALKNAASAVSAGGTIAISLYRRTPMCPMWRVEKRLYTRSPALLQAAIRGAYKTAYVAGLLATGRNPVAYTRTYDKNRRGMEWSTDVHDWLGGYPYESTTPNEVAAHLNELGFELVRSEERSRGLGLFGTGCDEFVAQRAQRVG